MYVLQAERRSLHERTVLHGQTAVDDQTLPQEGIDGDGTYAPSRG